MVGSATQKGRHLHDLARPRITVDFSLSQNPILTPNCHAGGDNSSPPPAGPPIQPEVARRARRKYDGRTWSGTAIYSFEK
jgi:hypothetical protein